MGSILPPARCSPAQ